MEVIMEKLSLFNQASRLYLTILVIISRTLWEGVVLIIIKIYSFLGTNLVEYCVSLHLLFSGYNMTNYPL